MFNKEILRCSKLNLQVIAATATAVAAAATSNIIFIHLLMSLMYVAVNICVYVTLFGHEIKSHIHQGRKLDLVLLLFCYFLCNLNANHSVYSLYFHRLMTPYKGRDKKEKNMLLKSAFVHLSIAENEQFSYHTSFRQDDQFCNKVFARQYGWYTTSITSVKQI